MGAEEWPATEEWRAIEGYDGWYEVSSLGRVRSWKSTGRGPRSRSKEPRILRPGVNKTGHLHVALMSPNGMRSHSVHVLVAKAFIGPRPLGLQVCHGDGVPANNRVENLRYDTSRANQLDKVKHGTMPNGERHHNSKLVESDIPTIRQRLSAGERPAAIAASFGVTPGNIYAIKTGYTWHHVA